MKHFQHLHKMCLKGKIEKLPHVHEFPPNLIKLSLIGSKIQKDLTVQLEVAIPEDACLGKPIIRMEGTSLLIRRVSPTAGSTPLFFNRVGRNGQWKKMQC